MENEIIKDTNLYELVDELIILAKCLKEAKFSSEALNIKVALEAIITRNGSGNQRNKDECLLFLSYSNENTIKIAKENNLNIVLSAIKKIKKI
jgi:hypothetical protein